MSNSPNHKSIPQAASTILWTSYKSKEFLPVIKLNKNTFYQWGNRGNAVGFSVNTGRGSSVELDGHDIVYLAALVALSNMNQPPRSGKRGLRDCVRAFTNAYIQGNAEYRYCIGKSRPLGEDFMEWELFQNPQPNNHIVDACGEEDEPGWVTIDLLEITDRVVTGLSAIYQAK